MDNFERPLPALGLSAAEQAQQRTTPLTRRNSFDGDMAHLSVPNTPRMQAQAAHPAMMFAQRPMAAMPPPALKGDARVQQRRVGQMPGHTPSMQPIVPRFVDRRSREHEIIQFVIEIDQLESRLRGQMGWLAIDGVRNLTSVSMGVASVIGLIFSIVALTVHHLMPGLGIIVFASLVVSGLVLGVLAQTIARWLWARRNDTAPLRAELNDIRERLMRQAPNGRIESLLDTEIKLLRRLERLEVRLDGGFFNTLGDALIGTFGWDPRLGDMLGRAAKSRKQAAKSAAAQSEAFAARQAAAQAARTQGGRSVPTRAPRDHTEAVRQPFGPPRSASNQTRPPLAARRSTGQVSAQMAQQAPVAQERRAPAKKLLWPKNPVQSQGKTMVRQR